MIKEERKLYYLFSPFLRVFHWTMAWTIVAMFFTGLLIATPAFMNAIEPTYGTLVVDIVRNVHFLAAFLFCATLILRVYGFIINRGDRLLPRFWDGAFYRGMVDVGMHYMFLKKTHEPYLRNPIARMSYVMLYILMANEVVTGFAMFGMTNPNGIAAFFFGWVQTLLGGEYMVHIVHHYAAWGIILFVIGHVYMVIRADVMECEGEVSSMSGGFKMMRHVPRDVMDIEPPAR